MADPENFGGGYNKNFKHKTSKIRMSSLKLRLTFRPKSEIFRKFKRFFRPKSSGLQKKKKVFTEIETDFSEIQTFFPPKIRWSPKKKKKKKTSSPRLRLIFRPKSLGLAWWGGMHPEKETDFLKWRLIFRPKSLVLGCIPPPPPPPYIRH